MRYIRQLSIILLLSFLGELLHLMIPLPIPAAVYGLVLMLLALQCRLIKLAQVEAVGNFLLETMPIMFIPFAVGMLPIWPSVQALLAPLLVVSVVGLVLVLFATGRVTQLLLKKDGEDNDS